MDYTSFLFNKLLGDFNQSFSELPYDEMYEAHTNLLIEFERSKYFEGDKSEYQNICDFMKDQEVSNLKF